MSLINDALRRAREAQRPAAPAPVATQLQPVIGQPPAEKSSGLWLPALVVAVGIIVLFYAWQWWSKSHLAKESGDGGVIRVAARSASALGTDNPSVATASSANLAGGPVQSSTLPPTRSDSAPTNSVVVNSVSVSAPHSVHWHTNALALKQVAPALETDPPGVDAAAAANPPPAAEVSLKGQMLKLQAIVFHPTRPSAMVNGKFLFIGDRIGEFRVAAITADSATLVGAGRTNFLVLGE